MPVRDAGVHLRGALASLARQRMADFEIVAVDDGSRDGSGEALERAAAREPRLRVVHTEARGLPAALNTALGLARAPLLARHDADDLSHPDRLALQLQHLAGHPDVTVLGCRVRLFPAPNVRPGMRRWADWHNALLDHDAIAREVLVDSPLAHGTAVIRRAALEAAGGWAERGWPEDLDLWIRLIERGARFAKLPRTLYAWRQHLDSATWRDPRYRRERFVALRLDALERRFLRGARAVTLAGIGRSLGEWRLALETCGHRVHEVPTAHPGDPRMRYQPPLVLVFGAAVVRARWRSALDSRGWREGVDYALIA
jgi:glycosyltransferase involved in cell wall biosynthesis